MDDKVKEAMKIIKQAMIEDEPSKQGSLAHAWHCNIAMACFDSIHSDIKSGPDWAINVSNEAASRFMKLLFDVKTER